MSQIHIQRPKAEKTPPQSEKAAPAALSTSLPPAMPPVMPPAAPPPGKPVNLSEAIRRKMEKVFGADLSAVRLYENSAVAEGGARAVAQGSRIAFAPGETDFHTREGQALLGHELSHVLSQARGEVRGSGFLVNRALEARADREGALAAAERPVYAGPVAGPLSDASAAPAAGPMQAEKITDEELTRMANQFRAGKEGRPSDAANADALMGSDDLSKSEDSTESEDGTGSKRASPVSDGDESIPPQNPGAETGSQDLGAGTALQRAGTGGAAPPDRFGEFAVASKGYTTIGRSFTLANKSAEIIESAAKAGHDTGSALTNGFTGLSAGGLGFLGGTTGMVVNAVNAGRGVKNIKSGGSRMEPVLSLGDFIAAGGAAAAGVLGFLANIGIEFGFALPITATAVGGLSAVTGGFQAGRGFRDMKAIDKQISEIKRIAPANRTDDQNRILQILEQGRRSAKRRGVSGVFKSIAGGLGVLTGALAMGSVSAPASAVTGALGAATGLGGLIYDKVASNRLRNDVIAEELGQEMEQEWNIDWEQAAAEVRAQFRGRKLSDRQVRKILMQARGYSADKSKTYDAISKKRVTDLFAIIRKAEKEKTVADGGLPGTASKSLPPAAGDMNDATLKEEKGMTAADGGLPGTTPKSPPSAEDDMDKAVQRSATTTTTITKADPTSDTKGEKEEEEDGDDSEREDNTKKKPENPPEVKPVNHAEVEVEKLPEEKPENLAEEKPVNPPEVKPVNHAKAVGDADDEEDASGSFVADTGKGRPVRKNKQRNDPQRAWDSMVALGIRPRNNKVRGPVGKLLLSKLK